MGTRTLLTVDEFLSLPAAEGSVYELSRGELITMTPGRPRHNRVRDRLARQLMDFVERRKLGEIFVETEFQLTSDTIRIPDAALVTTEALQRLDLDQPIPGAPALAIEVVSPNDLAEELATKVDQYSSAGAATVWVIYPKVREIHVFQKGRTTRRLGAQDTLDEPALLPGFSLVVGTLFD
ncbi:MAG: Uma2 family endonuclease [Acidobacteriia bacterium]|nr:Uma2 family endonuclease [Terriglobia bacterium]